MVNKEHAGWDQMNHKKRLRIPSHSKVRQVSAHKKRRKKATAVRYLRALGEIGKPNKEARKS